MKAAYIRRRLFDINKLQGHLFGSLKASSWSESQLVNYNARDINNRVNIRRTISTNATITEIQPISLPLHSIATLNSNPRNPSQILQKRFFSVTDDMKQKSFQEWNQVSSTVNLSSFSVERYASHFLPV
jgi:hypothetical protein